VPCTPSIVMLELTVSIFSRTAAVGTVSVNRTEARMGCRRTSYPKRLGSRHLDRGATLGYVHP